MVFARPEDTDLGEVYEWEDTLPEGQTAENFKQWFESDIFKPEKLVRISHEKHGNVIMLECLNINKTGYLKIYFLEGSKVAVETDVAPWAMVRSPLLEEGTEGYKDLVGRIKKGVKANHETTALARESGSGKFRISFQELPLKDGDDLRIGRRFICVSPLTNGGIKELAQILVPHNTKQAEIIALDSNAFTAKEILDMFNRDMKEVINSEEESKTNEPAVEQS